MPSAVYILADQWRSYPHAVVRDVSASSSLPVRDFAFVTHSPSRPSLPFLVRVTFAAAGPPAELRYPARASGAKTWVCTAGVRLSPLTLHLYTSSVRIITSLSQFSPCQPYSYYQSHQASCLAVQPKLPMHLLMSLDHSRVSLSASSSPRCLH